MDAISADAVAGVEEDAEEEDAAVGEGARDPARRVEIVPIRKFAATTENQTTAIEYHSFFLLLQR